MSDQVRLTAVAILAAFLVVQAIVVLQLLLTVQRYVGVEQGPEVGRWIPPMPFHTIDGQLVVIGASGRGSILVFVGAACGACHAMLPWLQQLAKQNDHVEMTFLGAGDEARNREFAREV